MGIDQRTEMSSSDVNAFLSAHETGVLSLARSSEPYAIPISYGYATTDQTFYMRLVSTPDSEKRAFLRAEPRARLVIYEEEDDVYRSVLAEGNLHRINPNELTLDHIEQYGETTRPLFEIWNDPKDSLNIELYELSAHELSGRMIVIDR